MATALPNNACEECRKLGLEECKDNLGIMCPKNTLTGFHPTAQGAYAEFVKFSAKEALRLPTAVKSREGAAVEPLAVGLHAVNRGKVTVGERVLIMGGGPIGLAVGNLLEARRRARCNRQRICAARAVRPPARSARRPLSIRLRRTSPRPS